MDALDLGILRELTRDQVLWFGNLDPRLSAAEIARRLHVDRGTVGARLHAWERSGFLQGHEVIPSPALFGAGFAGGSLRVEDLAAKPRLLEDLGLVAGVVSSVDHVGPWISLLYVFETEDGLDRARRLLLRLPGVGEATPCVPFRAPRPTVTPTPLDWRILRAFRKGTRRPVADIAKDAGVSGRTLARRGEALVLGRAVWYLPLLDFGRYTKGMFVRFLVALRSADPGHRLAGGISALLPGLIRVADASAAADAKEPGPPLLDALACVASVGQSEDFQTALAALPGVAEVEVLFPRQFRLYPSWFDERISAILARPRVR